MIGFPKKRGRRKGTKDSKPRKMNPRSLANMAPPFKPGQVANPEGKNGRRPITDEYLLIADLHLPEPFRWRINALLGCEACDFLNKARTMSPAPKLPKGVKHSDYLDKGITFAKSLGIRMYLEAVLTGSVHAATEIREAMEGRSTLRIEIPKGNDRLQQLLDEFEFARKNPPAEDTPRPTESAITSEPAKT